MEPSKSSSLPGGKKKKKPVKARPKPNIPFKHAGAPSRDILARLPNVNKVPSLLELKGFLLEKGQPKTRAELPPEPKRAKPYERKEKVRMALSAPPNYQEELEEVPLYEGASSEEEASPDKKGAKGTPSKSDSGSQENESPAGSGSAEAEDIGEECSGLALTQLGDPSNPKHIPSSVLSGTLGCWDYGGGQT